jgi:hypothetical protein
LVFVGWDSSPVRPSDGNSVNGRDWNPILRFKSPAKSFPLGTNPKGASSSWQSGEFRIAANILNRAPKMFFVANNPVERFLLPQAAVTFLQRTNPTRGKPLPTSQNGFQGVIFGVNRTNDCMDVIGHHHVCSKFVTRRVGWDSYPVRFFIFRRGTDGNGFPSYGWQVEEVHGVDNKRSILRRTQNATSHSLIEPVFDFLDDFPRVLFPVFPGVRRRIIPLPFSSQTVEFVEPALGRRVTEARRHKIGRAILPPVRQMPFVHGHRLVRMKSLKARRRREVPHTSRMGLQSRPCFNWMRRTGLESHPTKFSPPSLPLRGRRPCRQRFLRTSW